jgi:hypothetical protein
MSNAIVVRPAIRSVRRKMLRSLKDGARNPVIVKAGDTYGVGVKTEKGVIVVGPVHERRKDVEGWALEKTGRTPKGKTLFVS